MSARISKKRAEKTLKPLEPSQMAMLRGSPKRLKQITVFVDKDHEVSMDFYNLTEQYELKHPSAAKIINDMDQLIDKDPDFLDPYAYAAEAYYEKEQYDEYMGYSYRAYLKALHKIATKDGVYPKLMQWGWLENRHIIRALNNFALLQWENGNERLALEIFRKLLASNPGDNIGARHSILALRLGYGPDYEELFMPTTAPFFGLDASKLYGWFDSKSIKFPEEFHEWSEATKELE